MVSIRSYPVLSLRFCALLSILLFFGGSSFPLAPSCRCSGFLLGPVHFILESIWFHCLALIATLVTSAFPWVWFESPFLCWCSFNLWFLHGFLAAWLCSFVFAGLVCFCLPSVFGFVLVVSCFSSCFGGFPRVSSFLLSLLCFRS